jgi:hypothetical protein
MGSPGRGRTSVVAFKVLCPTSRRQGNKRGRAGDNTRPRTIAYATIRYPPAINCASVQPAAIIAASVAPLAATVIVLVGDAVAGGAETKGGGATTAVTGGEAAPKKAGSGAAILPC